MTFEDFEELNIEYWDTIVVVDAQGDHQKGNYDGDFSMSTLSFKFQNETSGQPEIVRLSEIRNIKRA